MKYFKDNEGRVYAYEADGSQDKCIKEGLSAITEEEAEVLRVKAVSSEELIETANAQKAMLLNTARQNLVVTQCKILAGKTITEDEKRRMNEWLNYADALESIDTSTAPDIEWPVVPMEESSAESVNTSL